MASLAQWRLTTYLPIAVGLLLPMAYKEKGN